MFIKQSQTRMLIASHFSQGVDVELVNQSCMQDVGLSTLELLLNVLNENGENRITNSKSEVSEYKCSSLIRCSFLEASDTSCSFKFNMKGYPQTLSTCKHTHTHTQTKHTHTHTRTFSVFVAVWLIWFWLLVYLSACFPLSLSQCLVWSYATPPGVCSSRGWTE